MIRVWFYMMLIALAMSIIIAMWPAIMLLSMLFEVREEKDNYFCLLGRLPVPPRASRTLGWILFPALFPVFFTGRFLTGLAASFILAYIALRNEWREWRDRERFCSLRGA